MTTEIEFLLIVLPHLQAEKQVYNVEEVRYNMSKFNYSRYISQNFNTRKAITNFLRDQMICQQGKHSGLQLFGCLLNSGIGLYFGATEEFFAVWPTQLELITLFKV